MFPCLWKVEQRKAIKEGCLSLSKLTGLSEKIIAIICDFSKKTYDSDVEHSVFASVGCRCPYINAIISINSSRSIPHPVL